MHFFSQENVNETEREIMLLFSDNNKVYIVEVFNSTSNFPIGILGQVWYLTVSAPDLCTLTYFFYF